MDDIIDRISTKISVFKIEKAISYKKKKRQESLESWVGLIPRVTSCEICGSEIFFNNGNKEKAIHFDHRNGGLEPIKEQPTNWLQYHPRNSKNEIIWKECDFGMLCSKCNSVLPTKNRKDLLTNLVKYLEKLELKVSTPEI